MTREELQKLDNDKLNILAARNVMWYGPNPENQPPRSPSGKFWNATQDFNDAFDLLYLIRYKFSENKQKFFFAELEEMTRKSYGKDCKFEWPKLVFFMVPRLVVIAALLANEVD